MYSGSFQNLNMTGPENNNTGSLSNLSSGSEGNLMRGPGSDIDLNALYKSDLNRSMPNVPNTLSVPNQYMGNLSASNPNMAPLRTAPAPPTPAFMPMGPQPNGLAQMQPNAFTQMPMQQNGMQFVAAPMAQVPNQQLGVPNMQNVMGVPMGVPNGMPVGIGVPGGVQPSVQNPGFTSNFVPEITVSEAPVAPQPEIGTFLFCSL